MPKRTKSGVGTEANDAVNALLVGVARGAWLWRFELGLVAAAGGGWLLVDRNLGPGPATVLIGSIIGGLCIVSRVREATWRHHVDMSLRRQWYKACEQVGLVSRRLPHGPIVRKVEHVAAGERLVLRVDGNCTAEVVHSKARHLAAALKCIDVRVTTNGRKDRAYALLVRRDPFADPTPVLWPCMHQQEMSLWDDIPIGIDEEGNPVSINLVERNVLIGGEPGSGKSVALSLFCAVGDRDRHSKMWILDGKDVELVAWTPLAENSVGPDPVKAIELLQSLRTEMEHRYQELKVLGRRKVSKEDGLPLHLVVVDELAFYLKAPPAKQRDLILELLRDLVARGRAAGIIVIGATQKPDAETVKSALRDLISFRLALRCTTPEASDTILGRGWASTGATASDVPAGQRGVGYLLGEGERPVRIKGYYLDDDDVEGIALECERRDLGPVAPAAAATP
jgi:hypothetical protein